LTFERAFRSEDLLGEVPGSVRLRRREARLGGVGERRPALAAESVAGRVGRAAGWASRGERGAALAAELRASGILSAAARTQRHHGASGAARLAARGGGVNHHPGVSASTSTWCCQPPGERVQPRCSLQRDLIGEGSRWDWVTCL